MTSRDFVRMQSMVDLPSKTACVQEAINILRASLKSVKFARLLYLLGALLCFVLLIGAFIIPAALSPIYLGLDLLLFIVRLFLIVCTTYLVLMSLLFFRKERHALSGTLACLNLILEPGRRVGADGDEKPEFREEDEVRLREVDLGVDEAAT